MSAGHVGQNCGIHGQGQGPFNTGKHREAVTTAHTILEEENDRLRSTMLDLKLTNEDLLLMNERLEILLELCTKSFRANSCDPSVIEILGVTMQVLSASKEGMCQYEFK